MTEDYKGYRIEGDGTFGMKVIRKIGKGPIPNMLKGSFTGFDQAKVAIDVYGKGKVTEDGEADSTDRG